MAKKSHQRGAALFIVIIFITLSTLLALWGARSSLFSELVLSNDADYQRAFEAAQATLLDAELDIRNETSLGKICKPSNNKEHVCREKNALRIPTEEQEVSQLLATLNNLGNTARCAHGLCAKNTGFQDFWNDPTLLTAMKKNNIGARYGQYTGAGVGINSNPILFEKDETKGAWYWIEILIYDENANNKGLIPDENNRFISLKLDMNIVYRITSIAYGIKPSTMVVLQQTYARQRVKD